MTHTTQTPAPIKFDCSRANEVVDQHQKRAEEVAAFVSSKLNKLTVYEKDLERFLEAANCTDLVIGNMYSTGIEVMDGTYNHTCSMIAHCKMESFRPIKNVELAAKKLKEKWSNIFDTASGKIMSAEFRPYKIKGNIIEFQIWF